MILCRVYFFYIPPETAKFSAVFPLREGEYGKNRPGIILLIGRGGEGASRL